jgi:putative spermidine/putrescine transport system permease protein
MRRRPARMMLSVLGGTLIVCILAFIVLPAVVVAMSAFNHTAVLQVPPQQFSLRWFERALTYRDFRTGFYNGLIVTLWASTIALVVGTAFAIALKRYEFRLKRTIETLLLSPLAIPHFTIGVGLVILAAQVHLVGSYAVVVLCHVVLVVPFVVRSVYVSLQSLDSRLELVATSLGARPGAVLRTITLPLLAPGLFGGWLFAAILSFNEFTASLFVTNQATQTLPVAMYNYVRDFTDPSLAALSVIYIAVTAFLLSIANAFFGLDRVLNAERTR